MYDPGHYEYTIFWSDEDQAYVGVVAEFPSLSWLAADQISALRGITAIVGDCITDMERQGEIVPEPSGY